MSIIPDGLRAAADTLDDIEALRIATENRYRMLTRPRDQVDADGRVRGYGLDERDPLVAEIRATLDGLTASEHALTLSLQRVVRKSPFAAWRNTQKGVGEKQLGRLLAALGDPYLIESLGEARGLRSLWAYAGYAVDGGTARRPRKGASQEEVFACGKPLIKMRAHLIAESCIKAKGTMRAVYDADRVATTDAVHSAPCVRCGPAGKPAQPGSQLSAGHQHARALRKVAKEVLRELWLVAREFHQGGVYREIDGQRENGTALMSKSHGGEAQELDEDHACVGFAPVDSTGGDAHPSYDNQCDYGVTLKAVA